MEERVFSGDGTAGLAGYKPPVLVRNGMMMKNARARAAPFRL